MHFEFTRSRYEYIKFFKTAQKVLERRADQR